MMKNMQEKLKYFVNTIKLLNKIMAFYKELKIK